MEVIQSTAENNQNNNNQKSDTYTSWKLRWFKFRRIAVIFGIPLLFFSAGLALHESDIPYTYAFRVLRNSQLTPETLEKMAAGEYETAEDIPNPAPKWALTLPMLWASWVHSQRPARIMSFWDEYMPLLDATKYHPETRMVAVACLLSMLGGNQDSMPSFVYYDKCLRKLEILNGYKGENWPASKFLNTVYSLCGDIKNPQIMMAGLQLLMELTSIPAEPKKTDIDYVCKHAAPITEHMTRELAMSLLTIYQDKQFVLEYITKSPPRKGQLAFSANFANIKRVLVQNRALDFAFELLDSKAMQISNMAMMILIGIVGRYPDIKEIKEYLGETDEEKVENGMKLVDTLARMAQEHFIRGEYHAALGAFSEAIKFFPTSAQLRYFVAKCHSELGEIEDAKLQYSIAMKLTPAQSGPMPEATLQLSNLYIKYAVSSDDIEYAAELLENLIDRRLFRYQTVEQINVEDIYYRLQLCLEKLGRNDEALDRMLQLCKMNSDSHQCHFECGRLAILCQDFELAEEHLQYAIKLEPFDTHSKYYYALCLFNLDDIRECKAQLNAVLKHRQSDQRCLQLLARCYSKEENWSKVLDIYLRMNESPAGQTSEFLQYQIGCIYENLGNEVQAIEAFTVAVDIWKKKIDGLGFSNYFQQRAKERKAFQNIQTRCVMHQNHEQWQYIIETVEQIGIMN